ncbi:MAG: hypothetical protein WAT70_12835 [Rhizobiaceae bacterium]
MKKRTGDPFMPADAFGRTLAGLGVNLLVEAVEPEVEFLVAVFGAAIVYADPDFAVVRIAGGLLLLHADHAYDRHPLIGIVRGAETRGAGVELRLYDCDPDKAEAAARESGHAVLAGSLDKPHGLRECHIVSPHGFVFVPCADVLRRVDATVS